jgi:hypothetical protein
MGDDGNGEKSGEQRAKRQQEKGPRQQIRNAITLAPGIGEVIACWDLPANSLLEL